MNVAGVLVPLVTPLTTTGAVSAGCVASLVASVRPHACGLIVGLSTGEGAALSARQWTDMLEATLEHARELPVIAGVLLADAPTIARRVARLPSPVQAVAVAPPFRRASRNVDVVAHFSAVRRATSTPILVYNESQLSGVTMTVPTIRSVCELGGVAAIKDSSGRIDTGRELAATLDAPVFQGRERLLADSVSFAGSAVGLANLEPRLCAAALGDRSGPAGDAVAEAVLRYDLDSPTWYRGVKHELVRRSVIRTSMTVGGGGS